MRNLDFSSWEGILSTLLGLVLITVIGVGIRLLAMHTIQQRRERENRQINERLRTLIAAYKTLGGSFTGNLEVDPTHLRDLRRRADTAAASLDPAADSGTLQSIAGQGNGDRSRRVRDAVEAALSDIILLGTEEQVRLPRLLPLSLWLAAPFIQPNWLLPCVTSSVWCLILTLFPQRFRFQGKGRFVRLLRVAAKATRAIQRAALKVVVLQAATVAQWALRRSLSPGKTRIVESGLNPVLGVLHFVLCLA